MEKYKKFADDSTMLNPFVPLEHPPSRVLLNKLLYFVKTTSQWIKTKGLALLDICESILEQQISFVPLALFRLVLLIFVISPMFFLGFFLEIIVSQSSLSWWFGSRLASIGENCWSSKFIRGLDPEAIDEADLHRPGSHLHWKELREVASKE